MIEMEHSPLGGSGANRWMNCKASFLLQRLLMLWGEFEAPQSSIFADKGNAAHELGALCLTDRREPYEFVGKKIGDFVIHPDDLDPNAVAVYVNFCNSIRDGSNSGTTLIEQTIALPEIHPLLKGTVDFAHWRLPEYTDDFGLWVIDYKNGEGIGVSAVGCKQLLYYAVLLVMSRPELRKLPFDFPVHLGIVQPNYFGVFDEPEVWSVTIREIHEFATRQMLPIMQELMDDKREEIPVDEFVSGDHCVFCPVMLDCPRLREAYETYAKGDEFLAMLTDKELSELYAMRADAKRYGNELEKVVFARKISGKDIPSAKLVEKMVHRVFKSGAEEAAVRRFGDNAFTPKKLKSPAQFEKLSSDGKAFALEWGFKPDSERYTVAPLSDRRAEVKPPSNETIFKAFATPIEDMGW